MADDSSQEPYLWSIPTPQWPVAVERLVQRDARGFVALAHPADRLNAVEMNIGVLQHLGIFEEALYYAYVQCRISPIITEQCTI
jgi:hypothetical protein